MFKKKPVYKTAARIGGSERKQLLKDIHSQCSKYFAGLTPEQTRELDDQLLSSGSVDAASFVTSKGNKGQLYTHSTTHKPVLIKVEQSLVLALHPLWRHVGLVPTVLTGGQVLRNLQAGSDLMVKGMFEYSKDVKEGDLVAVRVHDKQHIIGIGFAALDFAAINKDLGGKGVIMITCLGDALHPSEDYPADSIEDVTDEIGQITTEEESNETTAIEAKLGPEEIDRTFTQALLYGLYELKNVAEEVVLPMSASSVMDRLVLPYLPTTHPDFVIKKTSWKKANKFLGKQDMLITKEHKGQCDVVGIKWDSNALIQFQPYPLPEKQQQRPSQETKAVDTLKIMELYRLSSSLIEILFVGNDIGAQGLLNQAQVTDLITRYAQSTQLADLKNPKMVNVDANLYAALKLPSTSQKQLSITTLTKHALAQCSTYYSVNGQKARKGLPPKITLVVEVRQGRKHVTKVQHLEPYFGDEQVQELIEALKRKCAGSVTLGEVKATKPGTTIELQVQGSKVDEAIALLVARGIPNSLIQKK